MQTHFRADIFQLPGQKMGCSHPGFESAERVLNRLASYSHAIWSVIQTSLHGLKNVFMFPSAHTSIGAWSAFCLDVALLTM